MRLLALLWIVLLILSPIIGAVVSYHVFYNSVKTGDELGLIMCVSALVAPFAVLFLPLAFLL